MSDAAPLAGGAGSGRTGALGTLALATGVLAISTASTFIRLAQAEAAPLAIAAWRLTIASVLICPAALAARRRELGDLQRHDWWLLAVGGAFLALHFAAWIFSLAMTSVAASVVLVTTYPLFVGIGSHLLLRERLGGRVVAGLVVAVAGSAVIGASDWGGGAHRLAGDGLAVVGSVAAAGYFLVGRRLRARMSLLAYVFPVYAVAAACLMVAALTSGTPMTGFGAATWLWLGLLALVPQIVGHSSLNWALKHMTATMVTLVVLAEPVGSTLLAWLFLSEAPTTAAIAGGVVVLSGIGIAGRGCGATETSEL